MYGTLPIDKLPPTPRTSNRSTSSESKSTTSPRSLSKSLTPYERKTISENDSYSNRVLRSESDIDDDDIEDHYWV
jgi:hypothetical protein